MKQSVDLGGGIVAEFADTDRVQVVARIDADGFWHIQTANPMLSGTHGELVALIGAVLSHAAALMARSGAYTCGLDGCLNSVVSEAQRVAKVRLVEDYVGVRTVDPWATE